MLNGYRVSVWNDENVLEIVVTVVYWSLNYTLKND